MLRGVPTAIRALNPDSVATGLRVNGINPDSGVHVNAANANKICFIYSDIPF